MTMLISVAEVAVVLALLLSSVFFFVFATWQQRENRRLRHELEAQDELLERQHAELKELEVLKDERHRPVLVATQGPRQGQYAYVRFTDSSDNICMSRDWLIGDLTVESEAKRAGFRPSGETTVRRLVVKGG